MISNMISDLIYNGNNLKIPTYYKNTILNNDQIKHDIPIDLKVGDKVLYIINHTSVKDYYTISSFEYDDRFLDVILVNDKNESIRVNRYISKRDDYVISGIVNTPHLRKCVYEYKDVKLKTKIVFNNIDNPVDGMYNILKDQYYEVIGIITDYDKDVILLLHTLDSIYYNDFIHKCKILEKKSDYTKVQSKRDYIKVLPFDQGFYI